MTAFHSAYVKALAIKQQIAHSRLLLGPPRVQLNYPRIIAVHFPKAGGTSLLRQFEAILGSGLHLNYTDNPTFGKPFSEQAYPTGKAMVFGHFHPAIYDHVDAFRMTFLRHPVDNLLSIYAFWKTLPDVGHELHSKFLKERPSILEFCRYEKMRYLMSETFFGGFDMQRFDYIGFDESRAADLERLSKLIGAQLSPDVCCNRTAYSFEDEAQRSDNALRGRMADILSQDITFYEKTLAQSKSMPALNRSSRRA